MTIPSTDASLDLQSRIRHLAKPTIKPRKSRGPIANIVLAICLFSLAAFLAWEVATRTFAAYLATLNPEAALRLRPHQSTALLSLASKELNVGSPPSKQVTKVRGWATLALAQNALNARAIRILGQLAAVDGDEARAAKLMQEASRRSLQE